MISTANTQSLTDFRQNATATLDRLNQTGEAEILTVNGEARAVLLSPTAYDDLAREAFLSHDVAAIRRSVKELEEGKGLDAELVFADLRKELLAMKAAKAKDKSR